MANSYRSRPRRSSARSRPILKARSPASQVSSEEAIKAGEQIAMAAFASGLKLVAALGTVAAKTAGLALASMASGADKFSELVKQEALRSNDGHDDLARSTSRTGRVRKNKSSRKRSPSPS